MTSYLVAAASVHVTAAAADYLQDHVGGEDSVVVVGVEDADAPARDVHDAANVARARLAAAMPVVEVREGDPLGEIRAAIEAHDPDVVVIGPNGGSQGAAGLGETASALLTDSDRPVVVVPGPRRRGPTLTAVDGNSHANVGVRAGGEGP